MYTIMKYSKDNIRTWIEIDKTAIKNNIDKFKSLTDGNTKMMAVVKSNAYGHGLIDFSVQADGFGVDWFGVDSIMEALALRDVGIKKPILVLGHTLPTRFKQAADWNICLTISTFESLDKLLKIKTPFSSFKPLKIHLKVDSGMHRQGFFLKDVQRVMKKVKQLSRSNVVLEGIFTHFSSAKNPSFRKETDNQVSIFNDFCDVFESGGFKFLKHAAASSGAILFPEYHFDMIRIGIGLYGLWPSIEVRRVFEKKIDIKPVLSWKTVLSEVKKIDEFGGVGYDLTEKVSSGTVLGICPIGYWHGFRRSMSSVGNVLVKGKRARVIGRVAMDMIVVDLTKIPSSKPGDEVVLMGRQGKEEITAEEIGDFYGSINYEVVTTINPLIKRFIE